jgi:hypothetical protein
VGSRFASTVAELDPELLTAAAHEVGHAVLARAYGITVISIEIDPANYSGMTVRDLDFSYDDCSPAQLRIGLYGDVAGFEGERLWCARHGGQANKSCATTDLRQFAAYRCRAGLALGQAQHQARLVLRQHWPTVERLTPKLARARRLAL